MNKISETDQKEMWYAICDAFNQCLIANEFVKAALGMAPELWPEFKRRDFQASGLKKVGEMEGYIVAATQRLARARKMITVLKTKKFEIEEASYEQGNGNN